MGVVGAPDFSSDKEQTLKTSAPANLQLHRLIQLKHVEAKNKLRLRGLSTIYLMFGKISFLEKFVTTEYQKYSNNKQSKGKFK